jgi:N-acetylneuraminate lyase
MGIKEMSAFLEDDRFIGIKYTSNDFFTMEQCKSKFPNKIVYNGFDEMLLCGLSMGADGGIGSTYNFMANKFVKIQKLFNEGNIAEAQKVQKEANRIITILCKVGVMQAEKEVLNQLGFDFGVCRHPFGEPTEEQKALIAKEITPYVG